MRSQRIFFFTLVLAALALQALSHPSQVAADAPAVRVIPGSVHIGESFRGAQITVSADIPKGAGAVLEMKGVVHEDHLLRQGRRGGLWMSVGEVIVDGAPNAYYVLTTPDLAPGSKDGFQLGYGALRKQMEFRGAIPRKGDGVLFEQFIKLKEDEGLYGVFPGSLKLAAAEQDGSTVKGQFTLPGNIAPGNYRIVLSVLNSGRLLEQRAFELPIEMRGLPGLLASLAYEHAVLYGLIAVAIAIFTGFMMGLVFKGKGAH